MPRDGEADLRYAGQSFELTVPLQDDLAGAFHPRACIVGTWEGKLDWVTLAEYIAEMLKSEETAVAIERFVDHQVDEIFIYICC